MDLQLKNKVAIVTGASRGIGRSIAETLSREGCRVILCARGEGPLTETVASIRKEGGDAHGVVADVTNPDSAGKLLTKAKELGGLDILVNNAGGNRRKPFAETTDQDWQELNELNVFSGLRLARAALPEMRARGGGAIVFTTSLFGREAGGPTLSLYNSTRSAIISAAKIMALELAPENIRVNTVAPGSIRFPGSSWDKRVQENPEGMKKFVAENLPLGRFGTVQEVADTVTFLCSPRASLITGACIAVDGAQGRSLI